MLAKRPIVEETAAAMIAICAGGTKSTATALADDGFCMILDVKKNPYGQIEESQKEEKRLGQMQARNISFQRGLIHWTSPKKPQDPQKQVIP